MKKRWKSYVMYRQNEKLMEFWKEYYKDSMPMPTWNINA